MAKAKTNTKKPSKKSKVTAKTATLHSRARRRYYSYMPNKKHHRIVVWAVFLFVAVVVALQMLYPPDRALPLTRVDSQFVGWQTHDQLAKLLTDKFSATMIRAQADKDLSLDYPVALAGAEPKLEQMVARISDYPFWQRFIPLSIVLHTGYIDTMEVEYTGSILSGLSTRISQELTREASNARLAIKDGELVATDDTPGRTVTAQVVERAIEGAPLKIGVSNIISVKASYQPAKTTAEDLAAIRAQAEAALTRQVVIVVEDQTFEPTKKEIASWLIIGSDENNAPLLGFDNEKLAGYLEKINEQVGVVAGQTNINLVNGREAGRTPGTKGWALNQALLASEIGAWVLGGVGDGAFQAQMVEVEPSVIYNNKYTATEEGLRAYVADAAREQSANIVIQQLDGGRWSAGAAGDMSIPSASTYKLFVALMLFDKMDKGQTDWNAPMLDTTVSVCFDRMTIASTNPCALKWLSDWGRTNVNQFVYAHGFSQGTDFNNPTATHSTANDLTKFMIGLENGSLIGGAHRDRLLYSLSVHPYRYGIPTGSQGRVWDKVGFLWDYVHDTAIVYHPKGKYVMTIMTKGRSYATIAAITRDVERIMYP